MQRGCNGDAAEMQRRYETSSRRCSGDAADGRRYETSLASRRSISSRRSHLGDLISEKHHLSPRRASQTRPGPSRLPCLARSDPLAVGPIRQTYSTLAVHTAIRAERWSFTANRVLCVLNSGAVNLDPVSFGRECTRFAICLSDKQRAPSRCSRAHRVRLSPSPAPHRTRLFGCHRSCAPSSSRWTRVASPRRPGSHSSPSRGQGSCAIRSSSATRGTRGGRA